MREARIDGHPSGSPDDKAMVGLMAAMINAVLVAGGRRPITGGGAYALARRWITAISEVPLTAEDYVLSNQSIQWLGAKYIHSDVELAPFPLYDLTRNVLTERLYENSYTVGVAAAAAHTAHTEVKDFEVITNCCVVLIIVRQSILKYFMRYYFMYFLSASYSENCAQGKLKQILLPRKKKKL